MSNVIKFPTKYIPNHTENLPDSLEEKKNMIETVRRDYANDVTVSLMDQIFGTISFAGFKLSDEFGERDWIFLAETIEAVLLRSASIEHPLHQFIDEQWSAETEEVVTEEDVAVTMEQIKAELDEKAKPKRGRPRKKKNITTE